MRYQPVPEEVPLRRRVSLLSNDNRFFSVGSDSESNTTENTQQRDVAGPSNLGSLPQQSTLHTISLESSPDLTPSSSLQDQNNFSRGYSNYSTFKPNSSSATHKDNEKETTF